jgi:hypothetical protein
MAVMQLRSDISWQHFAANFYAVNIVMEAIQLIASLISLIKACRTSLQAIEDFRDGNDALADLVRDVESFATFLQRLEEIIGSYQGRARLALISQDLRKALHEARSLVLKLQRLLERLLKTGSSVIRRARWLKAGVKVQKLRSDIRDHSLRLNMFLTLLLA